MLTHNFFERVRLGLEGQVPVLPLPRSLQALLRHSIFLALPLLALLSAHSLPAQVPQSRPPALEITRAVRPWEFLDVTGPRAALLGNESGRFEAWVYPLKILRNFHLLFHAEDHVLQAESLARTLIVRPESTTIIYASDTFTVRETMVVPIDKPGALIYLDIHSAQPLEVEAVFERDFQLEWPAVLSEPEIEWSPALHAFAFACERPEFTALIGSPTAVVNETELATNYAASNESSFRLGPSPKGEDHKVIALAASVEGGKQLESTYKDLIAHSGDFESQAAAYYRQYLSRSVALELPDAELQQAYDWARVNLAQSIVDNPLIGKGLVAGYRVDAGDRRPGYDWFFGRDALWTALALNASSDFATTRMALDFIGRFQRQDGKIPHEIPQTASLIQPLAKTPFAFASADATPLYLIAFDDYVTRSGDVEFARQKWETIEKTGKFLRSTFDGSHLARNAGIGHGWVEGGPLFPVAVEFYQAGLGVEAMRAWSHLASIAGHEAPSASADPDPPAPKTDLESSFWMPGLGRYAFALNNQGAPVDAPSVLATVPMWFGLLDNAHAQAELDELARPEHQADWGMRLLATSDNRYNPSGYHFGSVWPLFTGWASVAEYRYRRPFQAYENLRANALLTFAGAPGHITEVLSGDSNQGLSQSTPHQTWSSAMVIAPLLLGMFDLRVDALDRRISLAPQLPANWNNVALRNIRLGEAAVDLRIEQKPGLARLVIAANQASGATLDDSPAFSPHAHIVRATLNGRPLPYTVTASGYDQRANLRIPLDGREQAVEVRTEGDVRLAYDSVLPALGGASSGLRLTHESWSADAQTWTLQFEGAGGGVYELAVFGAQEILSVEGGELLRDQKDAARLRVALPDRVSPRTTVTLHLTARKR
jgi:glycogen debranching enzyme